MKSNNAKMLSVYYAAQKILDNNLAAPLGESLKPVIASEDYEMVANRALPFMKKGVNKEKLVALIQKLFTQIDTGVIKPKQYVGHEFSLEETLDQFQVHDAFMAFHASFFQQVEAINVDDIERISDKVIAELVKLNFSAVEMMALKEMFMGEGVRSPLTLEIKDLQEVVDCMYEAGCNAYGPTKTDQMLSTSVKGASELVPKFDAAVFL